MEFFNRNRWTLLIAFITVLFIILPPFFLSLPEKSWTYSLTPSVGVLGDAIGGLTSPFINGLAAILVFIAFREQVRANENFERLERQRLIYDQTMQLRKSTPEFISATNWMTQGISHYEGAGFHASIINLGIVRHYLLEFVHTLVLIDNMPGERREFTIRMGLLYQTRISTVVDQLANEIEGYRRRGSFAAHFEDGIEQIEESIATIRRLLDTTDLRINANET